MFILVLKDLEHKVDVFRAKERGRRLSVMRVRFDDEHREEMSFPASGGEIGSISAV